MLRIVFALLVVSAVGARDAAAAGDYPFCIRGCDFGAGDCSFYTYSQCQAAASGREAWCSANPFFHASREPQPVRYGRRRF